MSLKSERVSSELIKELNQILLTESTNKKFKQISITGADVSSDLSFAKVYFSVFNEKEKDELTTELTKAVPFFKKMLSEKLDIRQIPNLRFIYDESIEYGNKIEKLIQKINK